MIDTAGAELSREAEERGVAAEIAWCIAMLVNVRTPVVSVLLGQGAGGAALALLPADRVLAAQQAGSPRSRLKAPVQSSTRTPRTPPS